MRSNICCHQARYHSDLEEHEQSLQKALQERKEDPSYGNASCWLATAKGGAAPSE